MSLLNSGPECLDRSFREWEASNESERRSAIHIQKNREEATLCALTLAQLKELEEDVDARFLNDKEHATTDRQESISKNQDIHVVVDAFITPRTVGKGVGYALLRNVRHPLRARVFISHVWKETLTELLLSLENWSAWDDCFHTCPLWMCFTALYQRSPDTDRDRYDDSGGLTLAEYLGEDILHGPVVNVLRSMDVMRVLLVSPLKAMERKWCNFEFSQAVLLAKEPFMVTKDGVVQAGLIAPQHLNELSQKMLTFSCSQSQCSSEADEVFIDEAIARAGGYASLDQRFQAIFYQAMPMQVAEHDASSIQPSPLEATSEAIGDKRICCWL